MYRHRPGGLNNVSSSESSSSLVNGSPKVPSHVNTSTRQSSAPLPSIGPYTETDRPTESVSRSLRHRLLFGRVRVHSGLGLARVLPQDRRDANAS